MGRTRVRRRERDEEPFVEEAAQIDPEEVELEQFLDSLGGQGIANVKLYRLLPSGKQKFVDEGPPAKFSEKSVQVEYGGGDYLIRSQLNGRWHRSKAFSVEALPNAPVSTLSGNDSEIERLKMELEAQRLRLEQQQQQLEADRREREQRNHELILKMVETRGAQSSPTLTDIVSTVKDLRDLAATSSSPDPVAALNQSLQVFERLSDLRGDKPNGESGWLSELKPILSDVARVVVPALLAPGRGAVGSSPGFPMTAVPNPILVPFSKQ